MSIPLPTIAIVVDEHPSLGVTANRMLELHSDHGGFCGGCFTVFWRAVPAPCLTARWARAAARYATTAVTQAAPAGMRNEGQHERT